MFKISSVRSNAACIYWKTPSPSRKVAVDNHNSEFPAISTLSSLSFLFEGVSLSS